MVYTIVVHLYTKSDKAAIEKVAAKLKEASVVYSRDKETLSWFVMQDTSDPRAFTIVERYQSESKYHLENPYWKTFDKFVVPLLERPMDLRRLEELLPADGTEGARRSSVSTSLDDLKVEQDTQLWKAVDAHQGWRREQGNY